MSLTPDDLRVIMLYASIHDWELAEHEYYNTQMTRQEIANTFAENVFAEINEERTSKRQIMLDRSYMNNIIEIYNNYHKDYLKLKSKRRNIIQDQYRPIPVLNFNNLQVAFQSNTQSNEHMYKKQKVISPMPEKPIKECYYNKIFEHLNDELE